MNPQELLVHPSFTCVGTWLWLAGLWRSRGCSLAPKAFSAFLGFLSWQVDCRRDLMLPGAWIFHLETRCCSKSRSQRSSSQPTSQGGGPMKQDACCSLWGYRGSVPTPTGVISKRRCRRLWSPFTAAIRCCASPSWKPTNHNTQQAGLFHRVMQFLLNGHCGVSWNGNNRSCDATSDHI